MKNTIKILVLISALGLIAGCGKDKKELSCIMEMDETGSMTTEITSLFINKAYESGDLTINIKLDSYSEEGKEAIKNKDLCSHFSEVYKYDTNKCKVSDNDNSLQLTVDYDIYEYIHNELKTDDETIYKLNIEDTKSILEDGGYACKVK